MRWILQRVPSAGRGSDLAFEQSRNRSPGFSYEVQGVYQEPEGDGVRFYTYVVKEREGTAP